MPVQFVEMGLYDKSIGSDLCACGQSLQHRLPDGFHIGVRMSVDADLNTETLLPNALPIFQASDICYMAQLCEAINRCFLHIWTLSYRYTVYQYTHVSYIM